MTSKEALKQLKERRLNVLDEDVRVFYHIDNDSTDEIIEMFNIIEKDLEVLEILKENVTLFGSENGNDITITISFEKKGNEDKTSKVKEWLEQQPEAKK